MARPLKFDRAQAVEILMNEIWKDGYYRNSVKSMSKKLGITRSSFYNAFGSREALFLEVLELYFQHAPDSELVQAKPGVGIKKLFTRTFRAVCHARAADSRNRGCLGINSVAELCNVDDVQGPVMAAALNNSIAHIEVLLGWGVAQNEIDAGVDLRALSLAIKNLLMGLNVLSKVVHGEDELWGAVKLTLVGLGLFEEEPAEHTH